MGKKNQQKAQEFRIKPFCGIKHPKKCVNRVYPEEGFEKEADLCHDCQKELFRKELVDESKFHYF